MNTNANLVKKNELQVFSSEKFGQVRTITLNDKPYFVANDICLALGYSKPRNAIQQHVDSEDALKQGILTNGGNQQVTLINESGVYSLIFSSSLPQAKQFKKWVTSEVLPAIRRTGGYMVARQDETPEEIMARALLVAQDTIARQKERADMAERRALLLESQNEKQAEYIESQDKMLEARSKHIKQMIPSVTFANAVKTSEHSILVGELATIIKQNGVEIGQNRLFAWLRKSGYLCVSGERYNLPTQRSLDMGLFEIKKTSIVKPDGTTLVTTTPKVTGKGQIYFVNKFLYEEHNRIGAEFQVKLEAERKGGAK